jgi:hypothetical protein
MPHVPQQNSISAVLTSALRYCLNSGTTTSDSEFYQQMRVLGVFVHIWTAVLNLFSMDHQRRITVVGTVLCACAALQA